MQDWSGIRNESVIEIKFLCNYVQEDNVNATYFLASGRVANDREGKNAVGLSSQCFSVQLIFSRVALSARNLIALRCAIKDEDAFCIPLKKGRFDFCRFSPNVIFFQHIEQNFFLIVAL